MRKMIWLQVDYAPTRPMQDVSAVLLYIKRLIL